MYPEVSPYALMWEAEPFLNQEGRLHTERIDNAIGDTQTLLQLYCREPPMPANGPEIPKPSSQQESESNHPPTNADSEGTSSSPGAGGSFVLEDLEDGLDAETALSSYQNEPGVTPEVLDDRTPLFAGKPPGRWWEYALHGF